MDSQPGVLGAPVGTVRKFLPQCDFITDISPTSRHAYGEDLLQRFSSAGFNASAPPVPHRKGVPFSGETRPVFASLYLKNRPSEIFQFQRACREGRSIQRNRSLFRLSAMSSVLNRGKGISAFPVIFCCNLTQRIIVGYILNLFIVCEGLFFRIIKIRPRQRMDIPGSVTA